MDDTGQCLLAQHAACSSQTTQQPDTYDINLRGTLTMPRCTDTYKKTSLLKYFDLEIIVLAIALLVATAGFFVSSTAHASDGMVSMEPQTSNEQLASIDTNGVQQHKPSSSKRSVTSNSDTAVTDHSADADSQLGGFSREDGAMMGAYGDGEYAD
jgi:hypothetical protein